MDAAEIEKVVEWFCGERGCPVTESPVVEGQEQPDRRLCATCNHPLHWREVTVPKTEKSSTSPHEKSEFETVLDKTPDQLFDESNVKKDDGAPAKPAKKK